MKTAIFRSIGGPVRRSPVPRRSSSSSSGGVTGAFEALLAKLTFSSGQLKRSRKRSRR